MIIVGAGLAGLLAANMLKRHAPKLIEKAPTLPNNHSAVLRFRSSIVGDTLGIPFKKVHMIKTAIPWRNPVADALMYSYKNTGVRRSDRSIVVGFKSETRYIAPPDLITQMAFEADCLVGFNTDFSHDLINGDPIISTVPMPVLMNILNYEPRDKINFTWTAGATLRATIKDCDAYVSLLVPDPKYKFSRLSITGDELFIEVHRDQFVDDALVSQAASLLGMQLNDFSNVKIKSQKYSKIIPIDDDKRKRFMHWATTHHNIYSLGRYATWRPSLLLDDLVNDLRLIDHWIRQGHNYEVAKVSFEPKRG
jgi:hypothetical protein